MSFVFHEELHLKTLKVYNHPTEKCYNSVFQKQALCKSDKQKGCLDYYVSWNQTDISVGAPDNRSAKRHLCIIKADAIVLVHKYRKTLQFLPPISEHPSETAWTFVTLQFRDRSSTASNRYRNRAKITFLTVYVWTEVKTYLVLFSRRCKTYPV